MHVSNPAFFTAGHGMYDFMVNETTFNRSFYYNLLLQPQLVIPDHFFLQGARFRNHLRNRPAGDSWLEVAVQNDFVVPFYRNGARTLTDALREARDTDLRGFTSDADVVAERVDRLSPLHRDWSPAWNSGRFGNALEAYLMRATPPLLELTGRLGSSDFTRFWEDHRASFLDDVATTRERSYDHVVPISVLIQVTGERLLSGACGRVADVKDLLHKLRMAGRPRAEVRSSLVFYTIACEIYARVLAESLLAAANSPFWTGHVAALHLLQSGIAPSRSGTAQPAAFSGHLALDTSISLPRLRVLQTLPGDILLKVRKEPSADRYFDAVMRWRVQPTTDSQDALAASLAQYSSDVCRLVGARAETEHPVVPIFLTRLDDLFATLEKVPDILLGMVAIADSGPFRWAALALGGAKQVYRLVGKRSTRTHVTVPHSEPGAARFQSDFTISRRAG